MRFDLIIMHTHWWQVHIIRAKRTQIHDGLYISEVESLRAYDKLELEIK
jgi:hypothetical protein